MASLPVTETEHAHATLPTPPTVNTGWGLFRGAVVVATMLLLVGALAWLVFGGAASRFVDTDAKRVVERQKILADRNTEDAKLLRDPVSWLAKDKGVVRVPIDRAMALTIPELQAVQPHAAYPLTQSPPQPANAPTSPDKGPGSSEATTNPSASNPTVAQPSPAPAAAAPTPAPATSASNAPAAATPAPTAAPTPAPAATAVPTATPAGAAPSPDNNANNPGNPPVPGTTAQPTASAPAPSVPPEPPATPVPTTPVTPGTPEPSAPSPAPDASPAGTP